MIRRLILVLIGFVALGAVLPCAPSMAASHHGRMAMPGHCHEDGQPASHPCIGCAVDPVIPAPVGPVVAPTTPAPVARLASILADHRPGFDPPPPRMA